MRVTVFTQHFLPEVTAGRFRAEAFARELVRRGHGVHVVCPVPNHPEGVVHPQFRRKLIVRRQVDGIDVSYVWVRPSVNKTPLARVAYYGSYVAMAAGVGLQGRSPDVVLATSPPLSVAVAALAAARRHRVPWVFDVRDIWPDAAVTIGELPAGRIADLLAHLERSLYRSAAAITTVTQPFSQEIARKVGSADKVVLIPNGTTEEWMRVGETTVDRAAVGLAGDRFVWTYAGNLGLSHGLERAIDAAGLLGPGFQLVIMGDGPRRAFLEQRATGLTPGQVVFRRPVESLVAANVLRASDALLVMQRTDLVNVVSSKLYNCCAVGRPVIAVARGEMIRLVEDNEAGVAVDSAEPARIAAAVRNLQEDGALRSRLGASSRLFARANLREERAQQMASLLESISSADSLGISGVET